MSLKKNRLIILLLYLAGIINYLDRAAIALSMVFIAKDIHISSFEKGMVFGAFSIGYITFNFLGGYLSDRVRPVKLMLTCMLIWSFTSGLTGLTHSLWQLLIVRVFFGMAEGPLSTNVNKIVDTSYTGKYKAILVSIIDSATPIGTALAGVIVPYISFNYSWRLSFFFTMVLGLIWACTWEMIACSKNKVVLLNENELIANASPKSKHIKKKKFVVITIDYFVYNYLLYFLITWFPVYIISNSNISRFYIAAINSLPWIVGSLSMLVGGIISSNLCIKFNWKRESGFLVIIGLCLIFSGCLIGLLNFAKNGSYILVLTIFSILFLYFTGGLYWALINEIVPSNKVGTMGGIMHGCANVATIVAPFLNGYLLQLCHSYNAMFYIASLIGTLGGISSLYLILLKRSKKT